MTGELHAEKDALQNVLQRFLADERISQEDVVDHHRRRQDNEEERHAQEQIGELPLLTLPVVAGLAQVNGRHSRKIRRHRTTDDEAIRREHDGERNEIVDHHVDLLPFGKDVERIAGASVANETRPLFERDAIGLPVPVVEEQMAVEKDDDGGDRENDVDAAIGSTDLSMPEE